MDDILFNYPDIPICLYAGTAYTKVLMASLPQMNFIELNNYSADASYEAFEQGRCQAAILPLQGARSFIHFLHQTDRCQVNGQPIGVIGKPLGFGLKQYGIGIRDDIDSRVVRTIDFWLQALMTCFPQDSSGYCHTDNGGGSLTELFAQYENLDTTGEECGYVQYPEDAAKLSSGAIAALVIVPVVAVAIFATLCHIHRMRAQERRTKKRFVQQIARNIEISPNVRNIQAEKVCNFGELLLHLASRRF